MKRAKRLYRTRQAYYVTSGPKFDAYFHLLHPDPMQELIDESRRMVADATRSSGLITRRSLVQIQPVATKYDPVPRDTESRVQRSDRCRATMLTGGAAACAYREPTVPVTSTRDGLIPGGVMQKLLWWLAGGAEQGGTVVPLALLPVQPGAVRWARYCSASRQPIASGRTRRELVPEARSATRRRARSTARTDHPAPTAIAKRAEVSTTTRGTPSSRCQRRQPSSGGTTSKCSGVLRGDDSDRAEGRS